VGTGPHFSFQTSSSLLISLPHAARTKCARPMGSGCALVDVVEEKKVVVAPSARIQPHASESASPHLSATVNRFVFGFKPKNTL